MNVDGTNLHPIGGSFSMTGPAPAWSPDGQFIAGVLSPSDLAATRPELGVLPSKGGPLALAWSGDSLVGIATWAPDGAKLAIDVDDFIHATGQSVILLEPDGTGRFVLAPSLAYSYAPSWSSDGSRILFVGIERDGTEAVFVVHPDGTHLHAVVRGAQYLYPMWQPTAHPGANDHSP